MFVITNKGEIKKNAGVNAKNLLPNVYAIRYLFGILVIVNANEKNHVMLENIYAMKICKCR